MQPGTPPAVTHVAQPGEATAADDAVASPNAPAIVTADLSKRYGRIVALAGLTMTVPRGEVFGFLGPNGAGKTTAVKLLVGLSRPTAGEARIFGAPVGDRETRRRIGYLPELFRYQDWLTAREALAFHAALAGLPSAGRIDDVQRVLQTVGLAGRADDRIGTFSKGMQQRLGLAVALLGRPDLVFLDEPTSALDPVGRHDVREVIRGLKRHGVTVFLNSHLLSEVEQVCDRVAVVNLGAVIAVGTLDDLLRGGMLLRLRVSGLNQGADASLARFGAVTWEGDWLTLQQVAEETIPDVVADVIRLGGRVYAVEPRRQSLEDRFLQLLEPKTDADPDDRGADAP